MAAVLGEKMPDSGHLFVHMIGLYGTAASLYAFLSPGQHKYRLIVFFPYSACNYTCKAFMAVRKVDYQHPILHEPVLFHGTYSLFHINISHFLTAVIQLLQIRGDADGFRPFFFLQKLQSPDRRIQTPCGVQTGAHNKTDMIGGQFSLIYAIYLHQCPQSLVGGVFHMGQPEFYNNPVFIQKLHNVTYRGKSGHFQKLFQKRLFLLCKLQPPVKGFHYLIGHHRAANPFIRICIPFLLRINHRIGRRQYVFPFPICFLIRNLMVIGHNHRHPFFLSQPYLGFCRDAVVTGNDSIYP